MLRYLLPLFFSSLTAFSQCVVEIRGVACLNNPIEFLSKTPGAVNHSWNFNNEGFNNTTPNPVFAFKTLGEKTVTYTCELPGGTPCTTTVKLSIMDNPKPGIRLLNNDVQCFEGNQFCFRDSSLSGNGDTCLKSVKYLFSDGELISRYGSRNDPLQSNYAFCKTYQDPQGGEYDLTIEIEDCNGCIHKEQLPFTMKVELLPAIFARAVEVSGKCEGNARVVFINLSQIARKDVTGFEWDFGDGTKDTVSWDSVVHQYSAGTEMSKRYSPVLRIYTGIGCKREFVFSEIVVYNLKPYITGSKDSICMGETVEFQLHPAGLKEFIPDDKVRWELNPGLIYGYEALHVYNEIGPHLIRCNPSHICGPFDLYDTVFVIGPKAKIEKPFIPVNQRYQCTVSDTIFVADHSEFYHNDGDFLDDDSLYNRTPGALKVVFGTDPVSQKKIPLRPYNYQRNDDHVERLWDFGDEYCLPCTTDTRRNMNVGMNCRFSRDSAVWHSYTNWDSVYHYLYVKRPFQLSVFKPEFSVCTTLNVWFADSLYAVTDSVLFYGDNPLGLSARDSSVFSGAGRKISLGKGMTGSTIYDPPFETRIYIPSGNSVVLDKKDGTPQLLVNGPQYYNVMPGNQIITSETDTCLFVFSLKVFYDTLPAEGIRSYHKNVHKVALGGIVPGDSIDKVLHRKLFYDRVPACFRILLHRRDTVHPMKCASTAIADVALLPPSAGRLTIADHYCYGYNNKVVEFNLEQTRPGCMASTVWFNHDYKSDPDNWQLLNNLQYGEMRRGTFLASLDPYMGYGIEGPNHGRFYWVYNDTAMDNSAIQKLNVGLIIGNGVDPNTCADTVLYEQFAAFPRLNPDLVFAANGSDRYHVCRDTTVYVTIPDNNPALNTLADRSFWYIINNQTSDTLETILETYCRVCDHPRFPGQKVNYTIIQKRKSQNGNMIRTANDTIVTAVVRKFRAIPLPGAGLNGLRTRMADAGFNIHDYPDSTIAQFIWNGVGVIGQPNTGSRGCIDTTGIGHSIRFTYIIDDADVLHAKDSLLLPADSVQISGNMIYAYGFYVPDNGSYNIYRELGSYFPGYCERAGFVTLAAGFRAKVEFSDTIICAGRAVEAIPDFMYYSLDSSGSGALDSTRYWFTRSNEAGNQGKEGYTRWDFSREDDNPSDPATIFGSFPYARTGYGNPGILLGTEPGGMYYKTPGIYTLRVAASDSNACTDTVMQKIYVTGPLAGFYTDIVAPNCKTILELFDTSSITDPCAKKGLPGCDFLYKWTIDWGDGSQPLEYLKQLPGQIGHDYNRNGYYTIRLIVESVLGCRDTAEQIVFIPGPSPLFRPETQLHICAGDSVLFRNLSSNFTTSSQWLWNFGDGFFSPRSDTSPIFHRYVQTGTFDVYLNQYDSITGTGKYCSSVYPETGAGQQKITVHVYPENVMKLRIQPPVVCVGDTFHMQADLTNDSVFSRYIWTSGSDTSGTAEPKFRWQATRKGKYIFSVFPDISGLNRPACTNADTVTGWADSVLADFDIDESGKPYYCFTNKSLWAVSYRWGFHHDTDITVSRLEFRENAGQQEPDKNICRSFAEHTGINWICLEATNALGCRDTFCRKIENDFTIAIVPPNVFTPSGRDGFNGTDEDGLPGNNVFNIYTKNVSDYHLIIYDRWGVKVFESNDQTYDWNGRLHNTGEDCPDGTYYYILQYRYIGRDENEPVLNGVVRLIRD